MKNFKITSLTFLPVIVFLIVISGCTNKTEYKESGIKTIATVIDGSSQKKRGRNFSTYTTYSLQLKFKTKSGQQITVNKSVSQEEFNKVYVDCEIPIVYLPDNPTKLDLILTDEDVYYYYGIENRTLLLKDLYQVYNETDQDSVTNYLNTISYKWSESNDQMAHYWTNDNKKELVVMNSGVLTYVTYNYMGLQKLNEDIKSDGFIKTRKDSTGTEIYENGKYKIATASKIDKNEQSIGLTMYFVINLVKTESE